MKQESKFLLERRAKMTGQAISKPIEAEKPKPITKRSEKMKVTVKELKKAYTKFLKTRPFCEIKSPVCQKVATCVNHKAGRGKNEILNQKTWEASCGHCNSYIEENDEWGRKNGHKISRLKK